MNYNLNALLNQENKTKTLTSLRKFLPILKNENKYLYLGFFVAFLNSGLTLLGPFLIGRTVDKYITTKDYRSVLISGGLLLLVYIFVSLTSYLQTQIMGGVGQRVLHDLRNRVFKKIESLPIAFFKQNKSGDLISRINNDTDNLNQFFSQAVMQFLGAIFVIIGSGIFLIWLKPMLGLAILAPAFLILLFTTLVSSWIKNKNAVSLAKSGDLSAEVQESIDNFKVIVAFNRRDYFRKRFEEVNSINYQKAIGAGIANNILTPVYGIASNFAQLTTLGFGIYLISVGDFTIGLLISFLSYVNNFYDPLRRIATLWSNFQLAVSSWDRISVILSLESDLKNVENIDSQNNISKPIIEFKNVFFFYEDGREILHDISFALEGGKTYALVGPTGGGKTTLASLIARLYDPDQGEVLLLGKDIRSFSDEERTEKIGFILQDPFLFDGTVAENLVYGNKVYENSSPKELLEVLKELKMGKLLERFEEGLETEIGSSGEGISLGQKQLIAFMRAVLRKPKILILDEATANIDTVTEKSLEEILDNLPKESTKIIIAHRLNTIENADTIFFINDKKVINAGTMDEAMDLLLHDKRKS